MDLENEIEANEMAACWIHPAPEIYIIQNFSMQVPDEEKHNKS